MSLELQKALAALGPGEKGRSMLGLGGRAALACRPLGRCLGLGVVGPPLSLDVLPLRLQYTRLLLSLPTPAALTTRGPTPALPMSVLGLKPWAHVFGP